VQVTDDHQLITNGIYRTLRHPSYTGLILGFLGLSLFLQTGVTAAFFILIGCPAYLYRIKVEERALIETFKEQYEAYRKNSYALFPMIY
jgi:protein-S-isoprenylcysteine O-methyltransferase Ste14